MASLRPFKSNSSRNCEKLALFYVLFGDLQQPVTVAAIRLQRSIRQSLDGIRTRSPLRANTHLRVSADVRLACVRPVTSIPTEPGSNPLLQSLRVIRS